jgi:hypothetical protein
MTTRIPARTLMLESWRQSLGVLVPNWPWAVLFALAGGAYSVSLHWPGTAAFWASLVLAIAAFLAGVQLSRGMYQTLLGPRPGGFLALAHANLAVYFFFFVLIVFIGPFLNLLQGILIQAKGTFVLDKDSGAEQVLAATADLLPSMYGAAFVAACLAAFGGLAWFALRLTTMGAATVDRGTAHVFRTFGWTKGHVAKLGLVAAATHLVPFALGFAANLALRSVVADTPAGVFIEGAAGILLFLPFLAAGHAMAVGAYRRLKPEQAAGAMAD